MKKHQLIVSTETKLKAKRVCDKPKPQAQKPNEIYGIDMTKIKLEHEGWAYLVLVVDWYTKKIVGYTLDNRSKSSHWLSALNEAACLQCPEGTTGKGIKLVSANIHSFYASHKPDGDRADLHELQQSERKCRYRTSI